jgi:carboxylesterase
MSKKRDPFQPPRWRRYGRRLLIATALAFIVVGTYNSVMRALAQKYDHAQPRIARTGELRGAQEIRLGPVNADTAVILVHGFLGAQNNFGELPQRLAAAGFYVKALRLPGHGTTPLDLEKTPSAEMLNYVTEQVRAAKREHNRVFLVGHSMGSTLCVLTATFADVDGIVLGAPHFKVTHFWWYVLPVETSNLLTSWAVHWVYKSDSFIRVRRPEAKEEIVSYRYVPTRSARQLDRLAAHARDPDVLAMVRCPVLVLHGAHDSASSIDASRKAFNAMSSDDKTFVTLENSDHHVYMDYDRDQVYSEIVEWIRARCE